MCLQLIPNGMTNVEGAEIPLGYLPLLRYGVFKRCGIGACLFLQCTSAPSGALHTQVGSIGKVLVNPHAPNACR